MTKIVLAGAVPAPLHDAAANYGEAVRFTGDLTDADAVKHALSDADTLIYVPVTVPEDEIGHRLGDIIRGGHTLLSAAAENGRTRRVILLSTLRLFSRMPANWRVYPGWRPRPRPVSEELFCYLAECSAREITRASGRFNAPGGLHLIILRIGTTDTPTAAAEALGSALGHALPQNHACSYRIVHVGAIPDRPAATDAPMETILAPMLPIPTRPIHRVALLGAGGPVLSAAALDLAPDYALRLSDVRPLADIRADNKPQSPGAPLPVPPGELPPSRQSLPHDEIPADVTDPDAVLRACADCDAIINGTVVRHEPVAAFRVNIQGAYNVCRAAVAHKIRRLVHTGPLQTTGFSEDDYSWDWAIDQPPARPGRHLYGHTKFLAQEIVRVFAENYGLSVPNLLYAQFVSPSERRGWASSMLVTWNDSARALRAALEVSPEQLGSPYEEFHISNVVPHDIHRYDRARRILGWEAQDDLSYLWRETPR